MSIQEHSASVVKASPFPSHALTAEAIFFRSYSRYKTALEAGAKPTKESWEEAVQREVAGMAKLGKLTEEETELIKRMAMQVISLPSGRWFWVGGTPWVEDPANYYGSYNCSHTRVTDWAAFGHMMDLAMQGCGTGASLLPEYIEQLPIIRNTIAVEVMDEPGELWLKGQVEDPHMDMSATQAFYGEDGKHMFPKDMWDDFQDGHFYLYVGDSRQGWVEAYVTLMKLASDGFSDPTVTIPVHVSLAGVRPKGCMLKGFGGVSNPVGLRRMFERVGAILQGAAGRKLNSVECCLLIDEAALAVVAGNVRRCIAHGERVSAISGMVPIEQIKVGDLVLTSSGEYKPVVNFFNQGTQGIVEVITSGGSIKCTPNHRVAVYSSFNSYAWKTAGELTPEDRLLSVPHREGLINSTTDQMYLLGYFLGNGHADIEKAKSRNGGGGSVTFAMSRRAFDLGVAAKIIRILTGMGYTPSTTFKGNQVFVRIHRKDLAEYFLPYKAAWTEPKVPDFVWLAAPELRSAFLAGLADADGNEGDRNVPLNSTYPSFLRQVQKLYISLGIATTFHERDEKKLKGRERSYRGCHWLHIRGIQSQTIALGRINPHTVRVKLVIKNAKKNGLDLPFTFVQEAVAAGWKAETVGQTRNIIADSKSQPGVYRNANWDTLLEEGVVNPDWLPIDVIAVLPAGQSRTYDIEVEGDHEFICEGLLVHNSAGIRLGAASDKLFTSAKHNLWTQNAEGKWVIDPERDALRMANHTRVFMHKPTLEECIQSVTDQFNSGEGAVQYAPMSIARSSADILDCPEKIETFLKVFELEDSVLGVQLAKNLLVQFDDREILGNEWQKLNYKTREECVEAELADRLLRSGTNPCGEINMGENMCNLSEIHLNQLDPWNFPQQKEAFRAGALNTAALLHHVFPHRRYQQSRTWDPIVGVSITGLFDFFVNLFGIEWLRWWQAGRPDNWGLHPDPNVGGHKKLRFQPELKQIEAEWFTYLSDYFITREREYLSWWKDLVRDAIFEYCGRHGLRRPNRYTTGQPAGSKSLLTGASPGFHPPKAKRYVRRMTFPAFDPLAMAFADCGFNIIPGQKDKDEHGALLDNPFDPRCTEWLVEFPIEMPWANLPGAEDIEIEKFSALAQMDWWLTVQTFYIGHNQSATIELTQEEIPEVAQKLYQWIQDGEPYISVTYLARFNAPFPRLPFEKIDHETYVRLRDEREARWRISGYPTVLDRLKVYDAGVEKGPMDSACEGFKCEVGGQAPQ